VNCLNINSKFRILITVVLIVLMMEMGVALFAVYLIGPAVEPIVGFNTLVFLLVLNVSSFTFLISQLWNSRLRAKVVKSIFFMWVMSVLIIALGTYLYSLLVMYEFPMQPNEFLIIFAVGSIHPFIWLTFILPTIGVFFGEHGLYLLFKRMRKQRQVNRTNLVMRGLI
jgi:hypothetical protein